MTTTSTSSTSSTSSSTSSTSTSVSSISTSSTSTSYSSTSTSLSTSSTSLSTSSTSSSISSTSSSTSSTSISSTSSSTSISSTSSSISSTSQSSTSMSSTSSSTSYSSISTSFSSTSSSQSSTSRSTSSTSFSSTSSSSSTSTTAIPLNLDYSYQDTLTLPSTAADDIDIDTNKNVMNVAVDDGDYFVQYGSEYMIQEFKFDNTNNTDTPRFTWKGRTTYDTRISPILIQIYNVNTSTNLTIASYSETNQDTTFALQTGGTTGFGASFTGTGLPVGTAQFYLRRSGNPMGFIYYNIYDISGTFGTDSIPIGSPLAVANAIDLSTIPTSLSLIESAFPESSQFIPANGTNYFLSAEIVGGNSSNTIDIGTDNSAPTYVGNRGSRLSGVWTGSNTREPSFYLKAAPWETLANINTLPADTDFQITVDQASNVSNYYDSNNVVTFRVYQKVI